MPVKEWFRNKLWKSKVYVGKYDIMETMATLLFIEGCLRLKRTLKKFIKLAFV
jgi:hypothetical protein